MPAPHPRRAGGYMFAPPCLAVRRLTIIPCRAVVSAFIRVIGGSVFAAESVGIRRGRVGGTAMIKKGGVRARTVMWYEIFMP